MQNKISVISLISYDADMLIDSIKTYYKYVDEIVLGLDINRISWSLNTFKFDENKLFSELEALDVDNKIVIIEDNFHRSRSPIENDTHERNFLKDKCSNDLILSFDADEYLINAKEFFIDFLPLVKDYTDIELMFTWFLPYKEVEDGYLIISDENRQNIFKQDVQGFTANKKLHTYTYCRWTNAPKKILSPLAIFHKSFCRTQAELDNKINNFGHSIESKKDPFYATQRLVNKDNYTQLRNFKTSNMGPQWPALMYVHKELLNSYLSDQARLIYEN
jgi:hypothetical protein